MRMTDRSYVERNRASRERLRLLGERLTDQQLARDLGGGWTVGVALGHLAYWDTRTLGNLEASIRHGLPRHWWNGEEADAVNTARLAAWQATPPRQALSQALQAAEALDALLETLSPAVIAAILQERPLALERSRHRGSHLDDVERAVSA
jgi:hypothetical protein